MLSLKLNLHSATHFAILFILDVALSCKALEHSICATPKESVSDDLAPFLLIKTLFAIGSQAFLRLAERISYSQSTCM